MIEGFINRKIQDDVCVYWANPVSDGAGTFTYDDPIEINCFWLEDTKTIMDDNKREVISKAQVFVSQDLVQHEYLYHGTLDEVLESDSTFTDPKEMEDAFEIIRFEKKPSLVNSNQYVRKAYL